MIFHSTKICLVHWFSGLGQGVFSMVFRAIEFGPYTSDITRVEYIVCIK